MKAKEVSRITLDNALENLAKMVSLKHKKKVIVLVDNYDSLLKTCQPRLEKEVAGLS